MNGLGIGLTYQSNYLNDREQPMTTEKINLSLTIEQAKALKYALNIHVMLGLGDLSMTVTECLYDGTIPNKKDHEAIEDIGCAIKEATSGVVPDNYGIYNDNVDIDVKRSYEVKKVLSKAIVDLTGQGIGTVDNDGLSESCRATCDPIPQVFFSK